MVQLQCSYIFIPLPYAFITSIGINANISMFRKSTKVEKIRSYLLKALIGVVITNLISVSEFQVSNGILRLRHE